MGASTIGPWGLGSPGTPRRRGHKLRARRGRTARAPRRARARRTRTRYSPAAAPSRGCRSCCRAAAGRSGPPLASLPVGWGGPGGSAPGPAPPCGPHGCRATLTAWGSARRVALGALAALLRFRGRRRVRASFVGFPCVGRRFLFRKCLFWSLVQFSSQWGVFSYCFLALCCC